MSKLSDYLKKQKIDARRVLVASKRLEALQPEDRAVRLARRLARGEGASDEIKELAKKKARGVRAVTRPLMARALAGEKLSRGSRARLLRALNSVLVQKKKAEVSAADLF